MKRARVEAILLEANLLSHFYANCSNDILGGKLIKSSTLNFCDISSDSNSLGLSNNEISFEYIILLNNKYFNIKYVKAGLFCFKYFFVVQSSRSKNLFIKFA